MQYEGLYFQIFQLKIYFMEASRLLEKLKKEVYDANMELVEKGMVIYTWGNVSGIDREKTAGCYQTQRSRL